MIKQVIKLIYFRLIGANKVAKIKGVKFGSNCNFRTMNFGSEPYLIEIGDDVHTARDVNFATHDGGLSVLRHKYPEFKNVDLFGKIIIGNNVFIGLGTTILRNTVVGDNVIIGAGSVVKGELKSNSIYAGVPAKYICSLQEYLDKNKDDFIYTKNLSATEKHKVLQKEFKLDIHDH